MSSVPQVRVRRVGAPGTALPAWWVVCSRELQDLWIGGKALSLILIFCVVLGLLSYLLTSNVELSLLPLREMLVEIVKVSITAALCLCLVIGADSVSGERERATLEGLLLTPADRRQIVLGKFLAAVSPWPVAAGLAAPYWVILARGDAALGPALLWGIVLGSVLAPAFAGLGVLISLWCRSNKSSMVVSLGLFLAQLLPAVAGLASVQRSAEMRLRADLLQRVNPVAALYRFLQDTIVSGMTPAQLWPWLVMPVAFTVVVLALLFLFAGGRLRLDAGMGLLRPFPTVRGQNGPGRHQPRRRSTPAEPDTPVVPARPLSASTPPRPRPSSSLPPPPGPLGWWVVCVRDAHELWVGGKALTLLLAYTVVVGGMSWLSVSNSQLDLIPPKEMVFATLQVSIYVGIFMGIIIGADSLSGPRERAVLETLLLTPTSRRQIVFGKFLASASPWPAALVVSVPCLAVLSQGDPILGRALVWGAAVGTLLVVGFTGLGMLVSFWSSSNRASLFVSLAVYLTFLLPALLPGRAQKGLVGKFFQRVNPLAAADEFLEKLLVNERTLREFGSWLKAPVVLPILALALLLLYAGPRLRLEAGRAKPIRAWGRLARAST